MSLSRSLWLLVPRCSLLVCVLMFLTLITLPAPTESVFKMLKKKKFMEGFLVGFMIGNEYASHKNGGKGPPAPLYPPHVPVHPMPDHLEHAGAPDLEDAYHHQHHQPEHEDLHSSGHLSSFASSAGHHAYMRKKIDRPYRKRGRARKRKHKLRRTDRLKSLIQFPVYVRKSVKK